MQCLKRETHEVCGAPMRNCLLIFGADTDKYIRMEILEKSRTLVTLSLCAVIPGSFIIKLGATGDIIESSHT